MELPSVVATSCPFAFAAYMQICTSSSCRHPVVGTSCTSAGRLKAYCCRYMQLLWTVCSPCAWWQSPMFGNTRGLGVHSVYYTPTLSLHARQCCAAGCSVKQDGQWLQMPLAFPLRTGVGMLDGVIAKSSGRDEISTLMVHGELALRVSLPGQFSFRISWYQGIEGFTGWHGGACAENWLLFPLMHVLDHHAPSSFCSIAGSY